MSSNINLTDQTQEIVKLYLSKMQEKQKKRLEKAKNSVAIAPYRIAETSYIEKKNDTPKIAKYIENLKNVSNRLQEHKTTGGASIYIKKSDGQKIEKAAELIEKAVKVLEQIK